MVPDEDIKALMRRLDNDHDGEVSFSDFFGSLLPYFIYGNLKSLNQKNPLAVEASKPTSLRKQLRKMQIKGGTAMLAEGKIKNRAKSAKLGQNTFSKGYFNKHQDLLVFEEGKKYDYTEKDPQGFVCIRNKSPGQFQKESPGKENRNMQTVQQKPKYLFHQDQPELHFYRSPALSNNKGLIRKNINL